jgi:DNA polymerase/3'-5' exonuclease PolX
MNKILIENFNKLADLELLNGNKHKHTLYINFIHILYSYDKKITNGEELSNYRGVGPKTIKKVDEILETGELQKIKTLENKKNIKCIQNLKSVMGIGTEFAKKIIKQKIYNLNDLKKSNISLTTEQELGIRFYDDLHIKIPRKIITIYYNFLKKNITKMNKNNKNNKLKIVIAGSYRRKVTESKDMDLLFFHTDILNKKDLNNNITYLQDFISLLSSQLSKDGNENIYDISNGNNKYNGIIKLPFDKHVRRIDIRFIPYNSYYTGLLYFTGSKYHNIYIRKLALSKGYSLNEYRLLNKKTNKEIFLKSEKELYTILNIPYIIPRKR